MGVQWPDVGEQFLWVRRARKTDGSYGLPKNGRERKIALLPQAQVLDQVPRWKDSPFVFHTPRGEPLAKGNLYYHWNRIRGTINLERKEQGLKEIRFHDLRHFCATRLLEDGLDHFAVSVQMGHEDGGALVMARYGHPSKDAALDRLLGAYSTGSTADVHEGAGVARG